MSAETHNERVRSYFDSHAEDWSRAYRETRGANDVVLGERLRLALELTADVEPPARVLDAGCGAGPLTVELARRGYRVVAADLSPEMVELCRDALTEADVDATAVELACGDILGLGLEAGSFDVVYALGFLQYQEDEAAALACLRELLEPGGRLVVSGPIRRRLGNVFGLWDHVSGLRRRLSKSRPPDELDELLTISTHTYSVGRLRRLLAAAGFEPLASRPHGFVNYALIGPRLGASGELALHRFFTSVSRVLPIDRFANDLVALAARPEA